MEGVHRRTTIHLPGEAGKLLDAAGYVARIVVARADGEACIGPLEDSFLGDALVATSEVGTRCPDVRERVATGHFARAKTRIAAKTAAAM